MAALQTIEHCLARAAIVLQNTSDSPRLDAEVLLSTLLKRSRAYLYAYGGNTYSWLPTTALSNPTINLPACTATANTIYTVSITQNSLYGNVCVKTLTTSVAVLPKITSAFNFKPA